MFSLQAKTSLGKQGYFTVYHTAKAQTFDVYLDSLLFIILMENVHTVLNDLDMVKFTYTALDKGHSTAACTGTFFQLFYYY
jgi:hypothetical protein